MSNTTIRQIQLYDFPSIHRIDQLTNPHPWTQENLLTSIHKDLGYVYQLQKQITSFLIFTDCFDFTEILLLATDPDFQRNHFAEQLLTCLITYNKNKNISHIMLEVRQTNHTALLFYQKHGFTLLTTRKNYYHNPIEDALVLEKNV